MVVKERVRKFFRCANAILRIDGKSNDMVMLRLIEAHCIPVSTYAIEIFYVADRDERRQLQLYFGKFSVTAGPRACLCYKTFSTDQHGSSWLKNAQTHLLIA